MEEITILTRNQLYSNVLEKYGIEAKPTDLYKLQRGDVLKNNGEYLIKTDMYHMEKTNMYHVINVLPNGETEYLANGSHGVRPVIQLSEIKKSKRKLNKKTIGGIEEIEYGEYPQSVVDDKTEEKLEKLYKRKRLKKTNKKYTSVLPKGKEIYQEYEYNNKRYIRVKNRIDINDWWAPKRFKNRNKPIEGKTYWVKVEPIKWLIDKNEEIAISKYILNNMPLSSHNCNYEYYESDIKYFLENYFIKEINKNIDEEKIDDLVNLVTILYGTKEDKKVKVKKKERN